MGRIKALTTATAARWQTSGWRSYADDFYDEGGFGIRFDHSGVLFLIDRDSREIHISTSGTMIRFLTDKRVISKKMGDIALFLFKIKKYFSIFSPRENISSFSLI